MFEVETSSLLFMDRERQEAEAPEAALVASVRAGDREAFARLYELYSPLVHGVLLARVPYDEVGDLVQDVFLVAFRKLGSLRDAARFGPWVAMIARNRATDFHRRARETEERSEEHTSELQSRQYLVCRLPLEKKTKTRRRSRTGLRMRCGAPT